MNREQINKKLAQELKTKLNSPEYVAIPQILEYSDRYGGMLPFVWGWGVGESIHSKERDNWILDKSRKRGDKMIYEHQLEPADWEEIVNLIEKRNEEKKQAFEQRWTQIQEKLNNTPGLYYYWGKSSEKYSQYYKKADCWIEYKDMRGFVSFFGKENGRTHYLYIAEEHPILDKFSFEKGFCLIDTNVPIEKESPQYWSTGGEDNPHNFKRFVELENEISITPEKSTQDKLNQQIQNSQTSTKITEPTNKQKGDDNSTKPQNTGTVLLIVGGLLVIGTTLIIGYLLGKNKKTKK